MKNRPFITGIIAAASPLPLFCFAILWTWFWFFGIFLGLLNMDRVPDWVLVFEILPFFLSPMIGVLGIVHSIAKIKTKTGWLGLLLSALGLLENALLFLMLLYLGQF